MSTRCRLTASTPSQPFVKNIPQTVRDEIDYVVRETDNSGRENSLTFCVLDGKKNKVFVSNYARGDATSTYSLPCASEHGDEAKRIGDLHTHPTQDPTTIGITPSDSDFVSTIEDSLQENLPQISCITSSDAKMVHCYQPKYRTLYDKEKIKNYRNALYYQSADLADINPYIRNNVGKDFDHAWYDRKSSKRIYRPKAEDVVHDAFLKSARSLRLDYIPEWQKGAFCDFIQESNYPDSKDRVANECRRVLRSRTFLGFNY